MWKNLLFQGLIALLPVFLFVVWYDRTERTRFVPRFLGFLCGAAMLLGMGLSLPGSSGFPTDFRLVPFLLGSLYGGIPASAVLAAVYSLHDPAHGWHIFILLASAVGILLYLMKVSPVIRLKNRDARIRYALRIYAGMLLFFLVFRGLTALRSGNAPTPGEWAVWFWHWAFQLAVLAIGVNLIELAFERVNLQGELKEISGKYRGEMKRLQQFIDQAPLAVIFLDADKRITQINEACLCLIHPVRRKEIVGRKYADIAPLLGFDARKLIDRVQRGEDRIADAVQYRGRTLYVILSVVRGAAGRAADGFLFVGHDITELQRLKDELGRMERLSLVGQMAASITHEIRNPMAVIRGFVQLLGERSPEDQQGYFRIVMEELDRANGIINDFLSLAQNRIVEKELCSLHDILNDLLPLIQADANMRGQMVDFRLCGEMEPLEINSKEIKQLVLNLARNGMEAMGDTGVLTIETFNLADTVQLRVTDRGVGIPPEQLERLFEPFYTTKVSGTGLGLALCLSIVERHNGKIHVESTAGIGTSFIVSFCKPGKRIERARLGIISKKTASKEELP